MANPSKRPKKQDGKKPTIAKTSLSGKRVTRARKKGSQTPKIKNPKSIYSPENIHLQKQNLAQGSSTSTAKFSSPDYNVLGELPESYGSKKLYLVARDPYWLFVYWDFTCEQFEEALSHSHDRKIFLEVYSGEGKCLHQIQINPTVKNWYIHVKEADSAYSTALGYYGTKGHFQELARSSEVKTPRDTLHINTNHRFVTIPFHIAFHKLLETLLDQKKHGSHLVEALNHLQTQGLGLPFPYNQKDQLTSQELAKLLRYLADSLEANPSSKSNPIELLESLRQRLEASLSSWGGSSEQSRGALGHSEMVRPEQSSWNLSSLSSPSGGSQNRQFYMHVNAELIIYGGTDPNAQVRIDGNDITLREDGTFSYHWILPDGKFHIPIEATSPDGIETRSALLSFLRLSEYSGDVAATGQPPLQEPLGKIASSSEPLPSK